jgi:hypothetical protein
MASKYLYKSDSVEKKYKVMAPDVKLRILDKLCSGISEAWHSFDILF